MGVLGHSGVSEPRASSGHMGETATVCGMVASAEYEVNEQNQATLLDLGKPHPNAIFTAVIYGENRAKFRTSESSLRGKRICVTGQISDYHGKPEIVLTEPSQLSQWRAPLGWAMEIRTSAGSPLMPHNVKRTAVRAQTAPPVLRRYGGPINTS